MTVGFGAEGFEPALAVEWDRFAAATYAANWGEDHVIPGDIAAVTKRQIPNADLVIGGPPCQGFSNLGLKKLDDPRNQLWREYMRFIRTAKPQVFVIENVDRFAKSPEFEMLLAEVDHGLLKNYQLRWGVLNAADYGVSQRRRRTIVIGSRVGAIDLPSPTHARAPEPGSGLKPWATVRDVIEGLPIQTGVHRACPSLLRTSSARRCPASSRDWISTSGGIHARSLLSVTPTSRRGAAASTYPRSSSLAAGVRRRRARPT